MLFPRCFPGHDQYRRHRLLASALVLSAAVVLGSGVAAAATCPNSGVPGTPYEGFGADTPGGAGQPIYRVTTLADWGPGSLRDALARGNRCIMFDVAGDVVLSKQIYIQGPFVTVDGFSAPSPGITVRGYGISMWGTGGANDIILRGLRFRDAGQKTCAAGSCWDGIQIKAGAYRVVIDHVSSDHASDGAIDIGHESRDITVQWSLLSGTLNQALIGTAVRVSMHHNLFISGKNRNPQVQWDETLATAPPDIQLDLRNNVVWNFSGYGTLVRRRALANVVGNYYYASSTASSANALVVDLQGRAHTAGNRSGNGSNVNGSGTERAEFAAVPVTTTDACRAAYEVREDAGARGGNWGLDTLDSGHVAQMPTAQMPSCAVVDAAPSPLQPKPIPSSPPPTPTPATTPPTPPDFVVSSLSIPSTVYAGLEFGIQFGVTNRGAGSAAGSRLRIYLSSDDRLSSGDVLLRDRYIPPMVPGASQWHGITEMIPPEVNPGSYYLLLVSDATGTVNESNERNNVTVAQVAVARPTPTTPTPDLVITGVAIPSTLRRGAGFPVSFNVVNRGTGTAGASRVKIYLSTDGAVSAGDLLLRNRYVAALVPGASQSHGLTESIPSDVKPGSYYVVLVVDQDSTVSELNERNNVTATRVTVR